MGKGKITQNLCENYLVMHWQKVELFLWADGRLRRPFDCQARDWHRSCRDSDLKALSEPPSRSLPNGQVWSWSIVCTGVGKLVDINAPQSLTLAFRSRAILKKPQFKHFVVDQYLDMAHTLWRRVRPDLGSGSWRLTQRRLWRWSRHFSSQTFPAEGQGRCHHAQLGSTQWSDSSPGERKKMVSKIVDISW